MGRFLKIEYYYAKNHYNKRKLDADWSGSQTRAKEIGYPLWIAPYQNTSMSSAMWVFKSPYFSRHFLTKYVEDVKIHIVIRHDHSTKSLNNALGTYICSALP